jgi:hypothetical protein
VGDIISVTFTFVVDIAFVECVSFVVVGVLAPKPTFTWPVLRPLRGDDEDDDDPPGSFDVASVFVVSPP